MDGARGPDSPLTSGSPQKEQVRPLQLEADPPSNHPITHLSSYSARTLSLSAGTIGGASFQLGMPESSSATG